LVVEMPPVGQNRAAANWPIWGSSRGRRPRRGRSSVRCIRSRSLLEFELGL